MPTTGNGTSYQGTQRAASQHQGAARQRHRPPRRPGLRAAALAAWSIGAVSAMPDAAWAQAGGPRQAQGVRQDYSVPAGPLAPALRSLASAAGLPLSFTAAQTDGKTTAGVHGLYTVQDALAALLAGTGLQAVRTDNGSYVLRGRPAPAAAAEPDSAPTLPPVNVVAQQENAWGAVNGYVAKRSATATKTDTPILEVPQTIDVVGAEEIAARGAISVSQALRYTAGVSSNGYTDSYMNADEVTSRGFSPAPLYIDGAYLPYAGSLGGALQIEPYSLERVEVFKGPASVLYGQNQPGGIINMVTKKPTAEPLREMRLGAASYGRVDGAMDFSGPLNADKTWLYRLTALADAGDQQIQYTRSRRLFVAPSVTWQPSARTSLTLYTQFQRDRGLPDYQALPAIGTLYPGPDGRKISRDFFNGEPGYNDFSRKQYVVGVDFAHQFSDTLRLRQSVRYADVRDDWKGFYLLGFVANADGTLDYSRARRNKLDWIQHNSALSIDNNVEIRAETGPLRHTLLAGLDYRRFIRKYDGNDNYAAAPIDLYNPDYSVVSAAPSLMTKWDNGLDQTGLYLQDQIKWERWVLTLGGRYDRYWIDNKDLLASTSAKQQGGAFTGRAGLTFLAGSGVAPYLSYSESFLPLIGTTFEGASFKPTTGKQLEAGIKYQPPGSDALVTLSAFEIRQQNLASADVVHPGYEIQQGGVRSRGFELQGKARLAKSLNIVAALGYVNARNTEDSYDPGKQQIQSAPWSASLWADYRVPATFLRGLNIGAGVRWTGSSYGDNANTFRTPSFAVMDAALRYDLGQFDASLRGMEATFNVQNLFDRTYVSSCNYAFGCYYGKARTMRAGLNYRW